MSCILDILSKEELIKRKENLLKQLKKVDNEIKKRDDFLKDSGNTFSNEDIPELVKTQENIISDFHENHLLDIPSIESSDSYSLLIPEKSSTNNCTLHYIELNKKISKIKLKKNNNLENSIITESYDPSIIPINSENTSTTIKSIITNDHIESVAIKEQIISGSISLQSYQKSTEKNNINPKLKIKGTIKINIKKI